MLRGDDRHVAVTMEAPDPRVGGGPADPGGTQPAHDAAVDRLALMLRSF